MLICPFISKSDKEGLHIQVSCLEENCSLWLRKGDINKETITEGVMKGATVYEHRGACAFKVIARRV